MKLNLYFFTYRLARDYCILSSLYILFISTNCKEALEYFY